MNPEKPTPYKGIEKKHEEALIIDEKVDTFFAEHPRSRKSADEIAAEIIKDEPARLLSLEKVPEELRPWYQNMRNAGVKILHDNFLEITRWDNAGSNVNKPKPMRQKVDGINSAIRMQDHILGGYRNENEPHRDEYSKLESIQEVVEYANELLNSWGTTDVQERAELQQKLADVVLQLEKCKNEFKVETKEQAEAVMQLKDSRGRENPSALAARTVAALNNLTERFNQMQLIAPLIALRKEVLAFEKRRMQGAIRKADALLNEVTHHSVFRQDALTAPEARINHHEVVTLDRKIGQILYTLDTIHITPYYQQANQVKFVLVSKLKKLFASKGTLISNLGLARKAIAEAQSILRSSVEHFG